MSASVLRRAALALAASVLLLTAAAPAAVAATEAAPLAAPGGVAWSVQTADNGNGTGRANFGYDVQPGSVISDAMVVVNTGTEVLPLEVYAADAFTTPSGEIDLVLDAAASTGSGLWVGVDSAGLVLDPGARTEIPFTVTVPADATPGDHAAGIVTSLASADPSQSLAVERRLGTRINVRVAGELTPAVAVSDLHAEYVPTWNPFAPGTLTVDYVVANTGNTRIVGNDAVSATGPAGLLGAATPETALPEIIPGSVVEVHREIPLVGLGWLGGTVAVAAEGVGLGAERLAPVTAEYSVVAVPWALVALLLLLAAIAVTAVLIVRARLRRPAP